MAPYWSGALQAARLGDIFVNQTLPMEWSDLLIMDAPQAIAA
jgi:hypothetical protein